MVRYVPLFSDGQKVQLSWPLKLFRLNHIFWPLDKITSSNGRRFDNFLAFLSCVILMLHNEAELRYLRFNRMNLDLLLSGVPTYLILVEGQLRIPHVLYYRTQLRELLQKFFASVYVDHQKEPQIYRKTQWKLLLNRIVSALYLVAVSGYILAPVAMLVQRRRNFLFSMIPSFDTESLYIFVPLTLSSMYVALQIVTMVFGETALLCELMAHLKGRYLLIERDMNASIEEILKSRKRCEMAQQMREVLIKAITQNVELKRFHAQLEEHFTFRIFIMFAFSAILLCALGFKTYASPSGDFIYPMWFGSKTIELLSLGQLGSDLAYMTNFLSTMYYQSRWEEVIHLSTNPRENLRLMKVVALAIEVNYKPFYLTGLSYFQVSIQTVIKILQGAFSYFTFLTSIR